MNDWLRRFISKNKQLIVEHNYDELYDRLLVTTRGELTDALLAANVDFLSQLLKLPSGLFYSSGVEKVNLTKFDELPDYLFDDCANLKQVNLSANLQDIGDHCFYRCTSLTDVKLPDTVRNIAAYAFSQSAIDSLILPPAISFISIGLCAGCEELFEVVLPESTKWIGEGAFYNCPSLQTIIYEGSKEQFSHVVLSKNWKPASTEIIYKK